MDEITTRRIYRQINSPTLTMHLQTLDLMDQCML